MLVAMALEIDRGNTAHDTVREFIQSAETLGIKFKQLETLGPMVIGSRTLVRFRTSDLALGAITSFEGKRAVIYPKGVGYVLSLPDGRRAPIAGVKLLVRGPGPSRVYRGTGSDLWRAQFEEGAE